MGWNAVNAPRLASFKDAVQWHNNVKPIRGTTIRPLGERRSYHMASIAMPDPDTVHLNWCDQPMVTWHSDDSLTLHKPRGASAYTPDQTVGLLPRVIALQWNKNRIFAALNGRVVELRRGEPIRFVRDDKGSLVMLNPGLTYGYRAKRGVAKKLTQQTCGAFLEWATLTSSIMQTSTRAEHNAAHTLLLNEVGYPKEFDDAQRARIKDMPWEGERGEVTFLLSRLWYLPHGDAGMDKQSFHRPSTELMMKWMSAGNEAHWLDALNVVMKHVGVIRYHNNPKGQAPIDMKKVTAYVERLVAFIHRDEAFTRIELPTDKVPTNRNAEYFNELTLNFGQYDTVS